MDQNAAVRAYLKHKEYMEAYNKRPSVKAKRREYNKVRWQQIKKITAQLKEEGLL